MTEPTLYLKNIKIYPGRSEESTCYTADLYFEGVNTAAVDSGGQGGTPAIFPHKPYDDNRERIKRASEYALGLPHYEYISGGQRLSFPVELDFLADLMVAEEQMLRWLRRTCKRETLFAYHPADVNGEGWRSLNPKQPLDDKRRAWILDRHPDAVFADDLVAAWSLAPFRKVLVGYDW